MNYKSFIKDRIQRFQSFFKDKSSGQILGLITPYTFKLDYSTWGLEDKPLKAWDFDCEADAFIELEVKKLRCFMEYTRELDNDYIPSITASAGIGIHSAYFSGQEIIFGEETSWVHPCIHSWSDMQQLILDENNKWFRMLIRMSNKIAELSEGDYVPGTFCHLAPTDMANALRGNELFYDFYDYPKEVHHLMSICSDAIIRLHRELRRISPLVMGGSAVGGMWIPGEAPSFSEDAPDLCSRELFREFGFKHTQRVIDAFGGAFIHHHAKGEHIHSELALLQGLKVLEMSWDPNCRRPIDHIAEIYKMNGEIPLMTGCTVEDVYQHIDQIKLGRVILMINVENLSQAKEVMEFIRRHSKV